MERQCCTFHQKRFFTPCGQFKELERSRGFAIAFHTNAVQCGDFPLLVENLLFRDFRNHMQTGTGRLGAQSKMNICLQVFVLSVDTSAQHINYVMLPYMFVSSVQACAC